MASQENAITWLLANASAFNLKIHRFFWIESALPGWHDVALSVELDGRLISSRATDQDEDLALCKAAAELAERMFVRPTSIETTNGFAAHLDRNKAIESAQFEIVERDSFFCHYLTRTPFEPIAESIFESSQFRSVRKWAEGFGIQVRMHSLSEFGVLCVLDGLTASPAFGIRIGSAVRSNQQQAALAAIIEAARSLSQILNLATIPSISVKEFEELEKPNLYDHGCVGLDLEYGKKFVETFLSEFHVQRLPLNYLSSDDIDASEITAYPPELTNSPFVIARARKEVAQDIYIGKVDVHKINLTRVCQFLGRTISFANINKIPHPFD